jgi:hypothetical protein
MGRSGRKDPKLSEVKAVLQRLQGISADGEPADTPDPQAIAPAEQSGPLKAIVTAIVIFGAAAVGIFAFVALFVGFDRPSQTSPAAKPATTAEKPALPAPRRDVVPPVAAGSGPRPADPAKDPAIRAELETARALMGKGQVRAAREQLLVLAEQASPDAAWDLARSYDPNVLVALPGADAAPDVKEATRWYRAWYAAAVRDGLVADSVSLERIIGSMRP